MKSLKKIALITILFLILLINHSFASTGKVIPNSVRVRKEPNTTSEVLTNAYKDDTVEILDTEGNWYKVKFDGKTGYIRSDFLKVSESNSNSNSNSSSNSNNTITDSDVAIITKTGVRAMPNMISISIGSIDAGTKINKLDEINNWVKVTDGTVTGWVVNTKIGQYVEKEEPTPEPEPEKEEKKEEEPKKEETKKEEPKKEETNTSKVGKVAIVNVKTARIRSKAGEDGEIIDLLDYNDEVTITAEEGTWYKVKYGNKEGYISSTIVVMKDSQGVTSRGQNEERQAKVEATAPEAAAEEPTPVAAQPVVQPVSGSGQSVVDFARQFLGYPYVSAGKSPETGFDCSGFTKYIFSNFGATLGATAASQAGVGREVSREELTAGDLLLFYDKGYTKIGHTGIYMSGGEFIHAANPDRGVVTDNINTSTYYNERYITARRIVE